MTVDPTDINSSLISPLRPHVMVLFGATGDLARRKLLPGTVPPRAGRPACPSAASSAPRSTTSTTDGFRCYARGALDEFAHHGVPDDDWDAFAARSSTSASRPATRRWRRSSASSRTSSAATSRDSTTSAFRPRPRPKWSTARRGRTGRAGAHHHGEAVRHRSRERGEAQRPLHATFDESQIFRIDHFLGKEAALNILAFRFANGLFEPIWNRQHIAHVQIDVPETLSIGHRIGFYEQTGAYRDMVVNHLFQVLAFMAMEPPTALEPRSIGEEKNKVFRSLSPIEPSQVVRGQYDGYLDEPGVRCTRRPRRSSRSAARSTTGAGPACPFYLRTGKRMAEGARIISIAFREPPKSMFPIGSGVGAHGPDHLTFDLADASRLSLSFYGKRPGPGMRLDKQSLQFSLHETGRTTDLLEAYERLIYDAMCGDHTLFTSAEGIEKLVGAVEAAAREPAAGAARTRRARGDRTRSTN